ncbi:cysteate racemase [Natronincola ferrireducens]|uniref:Aspartate racemase n=1 Tax=Natronincola ferrireducens TaxID=393762 RepID=A0A1G8YQK9_9FIRM|nr:amino acid racemase [Natronincola ferrireducens]SDK04320.1 aspartate racemase [Natronincola ferrireducens]
MREKIIGILGGMGPEATYDIFGRIIKLTQVKNDSDHIRVIIDSNSKIPDRTKAILGNGASPIKEMIATAQNLQKAGADFVIIPCMTAHFFIEEIQKSISIPIIDGLEETNRYIDKNYCSANKIGLLATTGTIEAQLFQKSLQGKTVILPDKKLQEEVVMDTIYGENGIKAGNTSGETLNRLIEVVKILQNEGAEMIIAGCTEVGLVIKQKNIDIPLIDPLTVLAERAIILAKNIEK